MKYEEDYKTYKLYSITDQDIAASGGEGTSRLIKNDVLVFAPDIERPEIGLEIFTAKTKEDALTFIHRLPTKQQKHLYKRCCKALLKEAKSCGSI